MSQEEFYEYWEVISRKDVQMAKQKWNNEFLNMRDYSREETVLHAAVHCGDAEIVTFILSKGVEVDEINLDGQSALHYAVLYGYKNITETLIEHGANVNLCNDNGKTPLDLAKEKKHTKCVSILEEALLKRDIVQKDNVEEFKRKYAMNGLQLNREIVNLIGQIRPANIIKYIVSSPIMEEEILVPEVWQGEPLMNEINLYRSIKSTHCRLFENSVSIELINKHKLIENKHALQLAVDSQSEIMVNEVIKLLNDDINILSTILDAYKGKNNKFLNILRKRKCALDGFIKRGYSRLDIAVMDCSKKMLLHLLEKENDKRVITQALSIAIEHSCEECLNTLLDKNIDYTFENKMGQSLLHLSVESGNTAICHTLVQKCTDLNTKDYCGFTALQRAVLYNEKNVVEQMINKNKFWNTTLHIAKPKEVTCFGSTANSNFEMQKICQKQLHAIYDKLTEEETTLSLQVKANNDISEVISNNISECNVEFRDGLRNTILHTAVINRNLDMCRTIINISNETLSMKNIRNISPLRMAVRISKGRSIDKVDILDIIKYLISKGATLEQDEPRTISILQEAVSFADQELLILLLETEESVTMLTENEFKFIMEKHFFTFLYRLAAEKLDKDLISRLVTKDVIMNLLQLEQYCTLIHLFPHLNCVVRKTVINEYFYISYEQRNEDLFATLCGVDEFEMKLLNNGETIMTHIIKENNEAYILHLLEAKCVQKLANTPNYSKDLPIHLIVKRKWFNIARTLLTENKIVDEENAEGDTAIAILIKQLQITMDDKKQINEILNLVYTMIDQKFEIHKVSNISGRKPISYAGQYQHKIEQYYDKMKQAKTSNEEAPVKLCDICYDREINCVLDCGHTFCSVCVDQLVICPNCRKNIENPRKLYL